MSSTKLQGRELVSHIDDELFAQLPFDESTPLTIRVEDGEVRIAPAGRTATREEFDKAKEYVFKKYHNALKRLAE